ncbi:MAG: amidase [Candidatus Binatia bacterium]
MGITAPTTDQVRKAAEALGLTLSDADLESYRGMMTPLLAMHQALDAMPINLPAVKYPRASGRRPAPEENPYNAWYYKTSVKGAPGGKLAGRTLVLKDNIMLAGVPMMNGTAMLEGYVPEIDATVATRVLDAGAEIVGKAHCECLCLSAGSHTNATGPVHNPRKHGYSAGGSSSGCAALVTAGEVDMAIGGDQGGSIRIPSAFCGTYGMKPTYGLVPYTGILPIEITLDHTGPITRSVRDNALLLEVIAGADGYDPRQHAPVVHPYSEELTAGVSGLRIAVVHEGFGQLSSDPDVDAKVRAGTRLLEKLGARIQEISIPMHPLAGAVSGAILVDGVITTMLEGNGFGSGRSDLYVTSLMDFLRAARTRVNELAEPVKLIALLGMHVKQLHGNGYYGKAINLARTLTAAYDQVLANVDLLLMPTVPIKATSLPGPSASREEIVLRSLEPAANTQAFNVTHHPAMNVPCGMSGGLPVGMMLVGKHYDETAIYRAAHAFEQAADWTAL